MDCGRRHVEWCHPAYDTSRAQYETLFPTHCETSSSVSTALTCVDCRRGQLGCTDEQQDTDFSRRQKKCVRFSLTTRIPGSEYSSSSKRRSMGREGKGACSHITIPQRSKSCLKSTGQPSRCPTGSPYGATCAHSSATSTLARVDGRQSELGQYTEQDRALPSPATNQSVVPSNCGWCTKKVRLCTQGTVARAETHRHVPLASHAERFLCPSRLNEHCVPSSEVAASTDSSTIPYPCPRHGSQGYLHTRHTISGCHHSSEKHDTPRRRAVSPSFYSFSSREDVLRNGPLHHTHPPSQRQLLCLDQYSTAIQIPTESLPIRNQQVQSPSPDSELSQETWSERSGGSSRGFTAVGDGGTLRECPPATIKTHNHLIPLCIPWPRHVCPMGSTTDVTFSTESSCVQWRTLCEHGGVSTVPEHTGSRIRQFIYRIMSPIAHNSQQRLPSPLHVCSSCLPHNDARSMRHRLLITQRKQRLHYWSTKGRVKCSLPAADVWGRLYTGLPIHSRNIPIADVHSLVNYAQQLRVASLECQTLLDWYNSPVPSTRTYLAEQIPVSQLPHDIFLKLKIDRIIDVLPSGSPVYGFALLSVTPERLHSTPRLRVIADTLALNVLHPPLSDDYVVPTPIPALLTNMIDMYALDTPVLSVSLDLEKSFFQIPLPTSLSLFTVVRAPDGALYVFKRLPMGYTRATAILTCIMRILAAISLWHTCLVSDSLLSSSCPSPLVDIVVDNLYCAMRSPEISTFFSAFHWIAKLFRFSVGEAQPPSLCTVHRGLQLLLPQTGTLARTSGIRVCLKPSFCEKLKYSVSCALQCQVLTHPQMAFLAGIAEYVFEALSDGWDYKTHFPLFEALRYMDSHRRGDQRILFSARLRRALIGSLNFAEKVRTCIPVNWTFPSILVSDASSNFLGSLYATQCSPLSVVLTQHNLCNISVAELTAILFGTSVLLPGIVLPTALLLLTDNMGAFYALLNRSCRSPALSRVLQTLLKFFKQWRVHFRPVWIPTELNRCLADPVTRGALQGTVTLPPVERRGCCSLAPLWRLDGLRWSARFVDWEMADTYHFRVFPSISSDCP